MARQQRVQEYLDKNKIGALFEELMGKVISDMPDDPVTFLIHTLQRKAERQDRSHLRRSTGDIEGTVVYRLQKNARIGTRSVSPDGLRKSASAWAGHRPDSLAVAKERGYEKPWKTNSKRLKPKQTLESEEDPKLVRKSQVRPDWDGKPKVTATVFDDFWRSPTQAKRTIAGRSPSPARPTTGVSWADPSNEDEELLFRSQGYRGPRRRTAETHDPLAGEFSLTKETAKPKDTSTAIVPQKKPKDQKTVAMRHKKLLEQFILDRKQKADSGIEDDKEDSDDGVEVMEDLDELQAEGARKRKPVGLKTVVRMRGMFRRKRPSSEPPMRVSICARCAKMMTGGVPSQPSQPTEVGTAYGELPSYSKDQTKDVRSSKPGPSHSDVRVSPGVDTDDEFESVSQVTGPRKPVWPEESDTDALTPRKGTHMFSSRAVPSKGRPMYSSPDIPEFSKKSKTRASPRASNPNTGRSGAELHTRQSATNKTVWSTEMTRQPSLSEDEDARNVSRAASGFGQGGTGWSVPTDYDTDTSIYGTTNHPYQTDQRTY